MNNIEKAEKKIIKLCKRYGVNVDWQIYFPQYKGKLPPEIQLAIKTLANHGMKILFTLKDISNPVIKDKK